MVAIFSVSEITRYIKEIIDYDEQLAFAYIQGEISNFKRHYSGHCYFTLKDAHATIKAVMFKGRAQFLKFEPRDGLKVIIGGKVSIFERDGQYQVYVEQMTPAGLGELSLAFAQLKEKLEEEGLFSEERKKSLPLLPKRVGIVTSPTGAALRDVVTVAKRRHPGVCLTLFPVQVQGPEAPGQIAAAIQAFNDLGKVDVIITGRGGGSIEELWAFNDERVVRAIAASTIPVVSAVGHQTDYTLADFAADRRAATPSQAAELVVPDVKELQRYLVAMRNILITQIHANLKAKSTRLAQCREARVFKQPGEILLRQRQQVDFTVQQLIETMKKTVAVRQHNIKVAAEKLTVLSPLAVLARGYSVVRKKNRQVVYKPDDVVEGEQLEIVLTQGVIAVKVDGAGREDEYAKEKE